MEEVHHFCIDCGEVKCSNCQYPVRICPLHVCLLSTVPYYISIYQNKKVDSNSVRLQSCGVQSKYIVRNTYLYF